MDTNLNYAHTESGSRGAEKQREPNDNERNEQEKREKTETELASYHKSLSRIMCRML